MNVLLINGSPHKNGCTFTALSEVAASLQAGGVQTTFFHLGAGPVAGCMACGKCRELGRCVLNDAPMTSCVELLAQADGVVIGSPVYYAGPAGSLCAFLDRLFYAAGSLLAGKPGAAVVNCRRGGASAAFDRLNKYFTINQMPVVSSRYWNSTHGLTPDEVRKDLEGMQTMRALGANMAWMLKSMAAAAIPAPADEPKIKTNFIS
ncbi:MAG: flavodoxin family protein [Desulfovibrionaceae bacterium]|nr:flavodoxin family protein [Desulfovibrionaceae bacterium]